MKVLLRRNVRSLGAIGEVVEVKPGYARNYLIPQGLGVAPTPTNVKAVETEKQKYLEELAKLKAQQEVLAAQIQGKQVTIIARTNEEGHLYGSVGPAQIVAALAEQNLFVETQDVLQGQPFRQVGQYEVNLRFSENVTATIQVTVGAQAPVEGLPAETAPAPPAPEPAEGDPKPQE
jgi:large subunit ribosomal protein L9